MGLLVLALLAPLNLLLKQQPKDLGLEPDGGGSSGGTGASPTANVVDAAWAAVDWTLGRAVRTTRFWWIAVGYLCGMFAWYAVQVHQTKYLVEIGFSPTSAAWALGFVSLAAIPGQIALGHLSDRIGRKWMWTVGTLGFVLCFLALILLRHAQSPTLLYLMVASQGLLGYGLVSVIGAIPSGAVRYRQGPSGARDHAGYGRSSVASIRESAALMGISGVLPPPLHEKRSGCPRCTDRDRSWTLALGLLADPCDGP
jgi:MFS family permease